jgi:hypothetical protein
MNAQLILDDLRRTGPSTAVPDLLEAQPTTEAQVEGKSYIKRSKHECDQRQERLEEQRDRIQGQIDTIYARELNRLSQANATITPLMKLDKH